jgi:hypothetical protein
MTVTDQRFMFCINAPTASGPNTNWATAPIPTPTNQSQRNVGMPLARVDRTQNCTWRCPMKKLYERLLDRIAERLRGPWPDAIPLPAHVADLRLDPQRLLLHLIKTTHGTGR